MSARQAPGALSFGLLIPELGETDIFEPVCQGMMASPLARNHALVWGSVSGEALSREDRAWQLCEQYIERRVSGVFFAPLEFTAPELDINQRIAAAFDAARIPVVLLDRTVTPYPHRGHHDLVGIDNRRAGFIVTSHVLRLGSRRVAFAAQPDAAATVDAREAGYREALFVADLPVDRQLIRRFDPTDDSAVRSLMQASPDAIVCANDRTAARLMHTLISLGHVIPADVRLIGIDDVEFAALLPVPLTTLRQPSRQIGDAALGAMLERVARPNCRRETSCSTSSWSCGGRVGRGDEANGFNTKARSARRRHEGRFGCESPRRSEEREALSRLTCRSRWAR